MSKLFWLAAGDLSTVCARPARYRGAHARRGRARAAAAALTALLWPTWALYRPVHR